MKGEAPLGKGYETTQKTEKKGLKFIAAAALGAVGAAALGAGAWTLSGREAVNAKPQPSATAEAKPSSTPTSPEVTPSQGEAPAGFGKPELVRKGDQLTRFNGIVVMDTRLGEASSYVAILNPPVRERNGQTEIGIQSMQRKIVDGASVRDGTNAFSWINTEWGGPVIGGAYYYRTTDVDQAVEKKQVTGFAQLSAQNSSGSPFRTAIFANKEAVPVPANLPTVRDFGFEAVDPLPEDVTGFQLTEVGVAELPSSSPFIAGQAPIERTVLKIPQ